MQHLDDLQIPIVFWLQTENLSTLLFQIRLEYYLVGNRNFVRIRSHPYKNLSLIIGRLVRKRDENNASNSREFYNSPQFIISLTKTLKLLIM